MWNKLLAAGVLAIILPNAYAGPGGSRLVGLDDGPRGVPVLCEHALTKDAAQEAASGIDDDFLRRPFIVSGVHDMTAEGLRKLTLDPNSRERDLQDLVLVLDRGSDPDTLKVKLARYAGVEFNVVHTFEFHAARPTGQHAIWVDEQDLHLSYQALMQKHEEEGDGNSDLHATYVGEPDASGVRLYLSVSDESGGIMEPNKWVTLGIDVPPDYHDALKYSEDLAEVTDDLRTPIRNWRRIGVLRFARLD